MTNAVVFNQVFKKYPVGNIQAVANFSLEIKEGEFFCLVGPSGGGKSTVLKLIAGLEQPTTGKIDKPVDVSMVFQSGALLPWLTVKENVEFGLKMKGKPTKNVSQFLAMVGLFEFAGRFPRELSGGQRQRVGIARALAVSPSILLLDEPFSALDFITTRDLHNDLLKIWGETKITIVMVSHLLEEAVLLADRVGVMAQGKLNGVVEIEIPRPRSWQGEKFQETVTRLQRLLRA